jgi:hypothetical protein
MTTAMAQNGPVLEVGLSTMQLVKGDVDSCGRCKSSSNFVSIQGNMFGTCRRCALRFETNTFIRSTSEQSLLVAPMVVACLQLVLRVREKKTIYHQGIARDIVCNVGIIGNMSPNISFKLCGEEDINMRTSSEVLPSSAHSLFTPVLFSPELYTYNPPQNTLFFLHSFSVNLVPGLEPPCASLPVQRWLL